MTDADSPTPAGMRQARSGPPSHSVGPAKRALHKEWVFTFLGSGPGCSGAPREVPEGYPWACLPKTLKVRSPRMTLMFCSSPLQTIANHSHNKDHRELQELCHDMAFELISRIGRFCNRPGETSPVDLEGRWCQVLLRGGRVFGGAFLKSGWAGGPGKPSKRWGDEAPKTDRTLSRALSVSESVRRSMGCGASYQTNCIRKSLERDLSDKLY